MRNVQEKSLKVLHFILKSSLNFLELFSVNACIPNSLTVLLTLLSYFFPCNLRLYSRKQQSTQLHLTISLRKKRYLKN